LDLRGQELLFFMEVHFAEICFWYSWHIVGFIMYHTAFILGGRFCHDSMASRLQPTRATPPIS
ncbi:MAG: hypothetical protein IJ712_03190, partial [Anaerovibrio sp.]|nr:hypothetical protein [Anaerovibrio sp.]